MKQYYEVSIFTDDEIVREILIARLSEAQYEAFEEDAHVLKAFIETSLYDEQALKEILSQHDLSFETALLPVTNWNTEWEKNFQPVVVDDFCGIRAAFHESIPNVRHEIIITPKMSFGTGHHATTFMMVKLMREVNFRDKYVFDFGTGTGILAILADKLGAENVLAIDNDEWSMLNAAENVSANACAHISLSLSGNIPASKSFDIILANINKQVIVHTLHQMRSALNKEGYILLSGLLENDFADVHESAQKNGLALNKQLERSGWIALQYRLAQ